MRVIAGSAKGHKLDSPVGWDTRPTTDRIKESLFNMLSPRLYDCRFLDLFSGTGAIGIEALSRGARQAVFAEQNKDCASILMKNLIHTKLQDKGLLFTMDVASTLNLLAKQKEPFDIIFLDPPYHSSLAEATLHQLSNSHLLQPNGLLVLEHSSQEPVVYPGWNVDKEKIYKTTKLTFLTLEE